MTQNSKDKSDFIAPLFSLLYMIAALILNLLFPNFIITYAMLGIAIIVGLVQLKKNKILNYKNGK